MTTTIQQTTDREAYRRERWENKTQDANAIVEKLKHEVPEAVPHTRIVGAWLWIAFPQKPERQTLETIKRLGFSWNRKREAWQNPCGVFRPASKTHDPRQFYGEEPIE